MTPEFWHARWAKAEIGFHEGEYNPFLVRYFSELDIDKGNTVFVPLCGKTRDMLWLESQGYHVIGVELSETAIRDFFSENQRRFTEYAENGYKVFSSGDITLICGDLFSVPTTLFSHAKVIYDRASLVALSPVLRNRYVRLMRDNFIGSAQILLLTFDRDREAENLPPFNVDEALVRALYGSASGFSDVTRLTCEHSLDTKNLSKSARHYFRLFVFKIV